MRTVFTVGIELPGRVCEYVRFDSDTSLLDADIVVFRPDMSAVHDFAGEFHQGRRCYGEHSSFELKERITHWRRELWNAVDSGKTAFVLLTEKNEVFVDSGQRTCSGTGRNAHTTRLVEPCSNYDVLPSGIKITTASGRVMSLSDKASILRPYWETFGKLSHYKVIITRTVTLPSGITYGPPGGITDKVTSKIVTIPLVLSKDRKHVLGAIIRFKGSAGHFVLLPDIPFSELAGLSSEKDGRSYWTKKATALGQQFLQAILGIDEELRSQSARTPTPAWAKDRVFDLPAERKINEELLRLEESKQALQQQEVHLKQRLNEETLLKGLLYEQGHALEAAIIRALALLGFTASRFRESDSEFDAVFESAEGRFIGEAEGKDSNAINIDKLRQLEMNIHEDFAREGVKNMAKPVLFGNAARLSGPAERKQFFTEKCMTASKRMGCALVRTPDLFQVSRYLSGSPNSEFAQLCREAILSTSGDVVTFPSVPTSEGEEQIGTLDSKLGT